jgi:GWxTD domain-containing protein
MFRNNYSLGALLTVVFLMLSWNLQAKKLTALFNHAEFLSLDKGPYLETYLNIVGNTAVFKQLPNGKYQGSIEVSISFAKGDSIKAFNKYNLLSPEITDTLSRPNFIDVQRFSIPVGDYMMTLEINDNHNNNKPFNYSEAVSINLTKESTGSSQIMLVDTYKKTFEKNILTKGDYDLVPIVSNFYHEKISELTFYTEFYNIDKVIPKGEAFLVNMYLEAFENGMKVPGFFRFVKQTSAAAIPILGSFPLKDLPTGNYNLVIEARDKQNNLLLDQKSFFQRKNPNPQLTLEDLTPVDLLNSFVEKITNRDSLIDYLYSFRPISTQTEINFCKNVIKSGDELAMRKYFLQFWQKRDAANPEKKWLAYKVEVDFVNQIFKTNIKRGYATDRGRVYLQYGKPDNRMVYDREPSMYPYEVWQYYKLSGTNNPQRNNRRFIFYNPDLVTNEYFLIHSDAIGEVRDDRWQMKLQKRNNTTTDFDIERGNSHYGNNLDDTINMSR